MRQKIIEIISSYSSKLNEALEIVIDEGISNYPIILVYESINNISIGIPVFEQNQLVFSVTTLEELFAKMVIVHDKVSNFRELYNHKSNEFCVLVLDKSMSEFIFLPK
jgi:hypothetical protein